MLVGSFSTKSFENMKAKCHEKSRLRFKMTVSSNVRHPRKHDRDAWHEGSRSNHIAVRSWWILTTQLVQIKHARGPEGAADQIVPDRRAREHIDLPQNEPSCLGGGAGVDTALPPPARPHRRMFDRPSCRLHLCSRTAMNSSPRLDRLFRSRVFGTEAPSPRKVYVQQSLADHRLAPADLIVPGSQSYESPSLRLIATVIRRIFLPSTSTTFAQPGLSALACFTQVVSPSAGSVSARSRCPRLADSWLRLLLLLHRQFALFSEGGLSIMSPATDWFGRPAHRFAGIVLLILRTCHGLKATDGPHRQQFAARVRYSNDDARRHGRAAPRSVTATEVTGDFKTASPSLAGTRASSRYRLGIGGRHSVIRADWSAWFRRVHRGHMLEATTVGASAARM